MTSNHRRSSRELPECETRVCTPVELHTTSTSVTGEPALFAMLWKTEEREQNTEIRRISEDSGSDGEFFIFLPDRQVKCVFYLLNVSQLLRVYDSAFIQLSVSKPEKLKTCSHFSKTRRTIPDCS